MVKKSKSGSGQPIFISPYLSKVSVSPCMRCGNNRLEDELVEISLNGKNGNVCYFCVFDMVKKGEAKLIIEKFNPSKRKKI